MIKYLNNNKKYIRFAVDLPELNIFLFLFSIFVHNWIIFVNHKTYPTALAEPYMIYARINGQIGVKMVLNRVNTAIVIHGQKNHDGD